MLARSHVVRARRSKPKKEGSMHRRKLWLCAGVVFAALALAATGSARVNGAGNVSAAKARDAHLRSRAGRRSGLVSQPDPGHRLQRVLERRVPDACDPRRVPVHAQLQVQARPDQQVHAEAQPTTRDVLHPQEREVERRRAGHGQGLALHVADRHEREVQGSHRPTRLAGHLQREGERQGRHGHVQAELRRVATAVRLRASPARAGGHRHADGLERLHL